MASQIEQIIGNVGQVYGEKTLEGVGTLFSFSVARPNGFGKDAPAPDWYTVAVWNDSVREQAKQKITVGLQVAVSGPVKIKNAEGRTFRNINAYRLGIVQPILPTRTDMWPENSKPRTRAAAQEDEDLGF